MKLRSAHPAVAWLSVLLLCCALPGCGGDGNSLENNNPGINDLNVVAAFGNSITQGSECPCIPYPARLAGMIGKVVHNAGVGGSRATDNVGRTQQVINQVHPAFMLILYGVNDVIHGANVASISGALSQMVAICKQNNVVPVLATYPVPIAGHRLFAGNTMALNQTIRLLAETEGLECVDLELEFAQDPSLYMGDGLHPNDAGTQIIAMAFADLF